jgi:hypothetical protein
VFLAGTIDLGNSANWQRKFRDSLLDFDVAVFNPRRDTWDGDASTDNPEFVRQVEWELRYLEFADIIVMNILGSSNSPISLLELGLFAQTGKLRVCVPAGFYRYGNVEVVCHKYGVPMYPHMDSLIAAVRGELHVLNETPCLHCGHPLGSHSYESLDALGKCIERIERADGELCWCRQYVRKPKG